MKLKNVLQIGAAVLLISFSGSSVYSQESHWQLGVQGGVTGSGLYGTDFLFKPDLFAGSYAFGIRGAYSFHPHWSVVANMNFERKSEIIRYTLVDTSGMQYGTGTSKHQFNCYTLPVMLQYSFGSKWRYHASLGAYVAGIASVINYYRDETKGIDGKSDMSDMFKKFDAGVCASAAVSYPIGRNLEAGFELRYSQGLLNLSALPVYNNGSLKLYSAAGLLSISRRF